MIKVRVSRYEGYLISMEASSTYRVDGGGFYDVKFLNEDESAIVTINYISEEKIKFLDHFSGMGDKKAEEAQNNGQT